MEMTANQYALSWQKLIELIIFKQKAEALGLAKLLGHTMGDRIGALQLQADIYSIFNETEKAIALYIKVSELYAKVSKQQQSSIIVEYVNFLKESVK